MRTGADSAAAVGQSSPADLGLAGGELRLPAPGRPRVDDRARRGLRGYTLRRLLLAADAVAIVLALGSAWAMLSATAAEPLARSGRFALLGLTLPLWVGLAHAGGLYYVDGRRAEYGIAEEAWPVARTTLIWSWAVLLVAAALAPGPAPLRTVATVGSLAVLAIVAGRALVRRWSRTRWWYVQNALLIGTTAQGAGLARKLFRHPEYGINLVACVDRRRADREGIIDHFGPVPVLRGEVDVLALVEHFDIDRVIVAASGWDAEKRAELLLQLSDLNVHVDLVPTVFEVVGARLDLNEIEGTPLLTVPSAQLGRSSLLAKRALDLAVSAFALVALAPVLGLLAVLIKLDSRGPVFFRQGRVGRDDRRFSILKFRSMHVDAEADKERVAALSHHGGGVDAGMFKIPADPRVTRMGGWLRRASLDELPQLFNILRGDMSLVGPRPLIETEDRQVSGRFRRRLTLTPGLTGLWQVQGRSNIPFHEMVDLDLLYVTNWSLGGDLKLLLKTASAVLARRGAY